MGLFQRPPATDAELEAARPLDLAPEVVQDLDEAAWRARAFRGVEAPQLTWRAIATGSAIGFVLAMTNVYVGLKTSLSFGVAITAGLASFALFRGLAGAGLARTPLTVLENVCMQSTASAAGFSTGTTMMSAVPALLLVEGRPLPWPLLAAWTWCLAALGVVLAIPMKRALIDRERLRFPSGTAAAVTLQGLYGRAADAGAKARALFAAAAVSAILPLLKDLHVRRGPEGPAALVPDASPILDGLFTVESGGRKTLPSEWLAVLDHGALLVGAGALVGLRVTASMLAGGLATMLVVGPRAIAVGAARRPATAWKDVGVWTGAPLLVVAGLLALALSFRTVGRAFAGLAAARADATRGEDPVQVPGRWFVAGLAVASAGVVALAWRYFGVPPHLGALAIALTAVLSLVAARSTGETDVTPTGPLGKVTQLVYGVLLPLSVAANLMTASITAGAATSAADLLTDLKTGHLLGAHPRRQFVAQLLGTFVGAVAATLAFTVLVPDAAALERFPAPAAQQWKAVAEVLGHGLGRMHPFTVRAMAAGACAASVLVAIERRAPRALRRFAPSATGVGLGLVLPLTISLTMFVGGLAAALAEWSRPRWAERYVVPLASGALAGESVVGVAVAALNNAWLG